VLDAIAFVFLAAAVYLIVALASLWWLIRNGYVAIAEVERTDNERDRGAPGETAQPGASGDETRSELRRIHTREDGQ
jgi:hypothetical protein